MHRFFLLACAALLVLAASALPAGPASESAPTLVFHPSAPTGPLKLVIYGDMRFTNPAVTRGTNPRVRQWLAARVADEHPQALLLTGDMPFTGSSVADWQEFQDETARWRAQRILVLPTTGNHEVKGNRTAGINNYLVNFPAIARHRYYSALLGSVEVIGLDCTMDSGPSSPQGRWFRVQLAHVPRQVEFLFILYHYPWMADRQSQIFVGLPTPPALELRNVLESYLPGMHARVVVFNGHIHNYERFERHGVMYVVSGGGGAEPYPILFRGRADLYRDTGFPVYHYLTLEISKHRLHAIMWKVKDPDAATLSIEAKDEFTIASADSLK